MTVTNAGFQTKVVDDVRLRVGQTRSLDVVLGVGTISEHVEVKASTGPADRSSAEAATVIDTEQISELPNNGRDWASFTLLAPFAQDDGGGDQRTIRFAGHARDDNNFSFDGVDAGGIQEQAQKSQTRFANFAGRNPGVSRQQCFVRRRVRHAGGRPGRRRHQVRHK